MNLVLPPPLADGGTIGVAAPSGPVERERLEAGSAWLRSLGYRVVWGANVERRTGFTAGSAEERAEALLALHFDAEVDAVVLARGGSGALDLVERLPWSDLVARPKIWMGFSDFSVLAAGALRAGLATFLGPMVASDFWHRKEPESLADWREVLAGRGYPRRWSIPEVWREGRATGPVVAGCLAPLTALLGTPWEPPLDGAILFFEDVDEPPYRLVRLLTTWRLAGKLQHLRGVAIGGLTRCFGPGGETPEELRTTILDAMGEFDVPIVAGLPFGHTGPNRTLAVGLPAVIDTVAGEIVFERPGVETWRSSK